MNRYRKETRITGFFVMAADYFVLPQTPYPEQKGSCGSSPGLPYSKVIKVIK